MVIAQKGRGTLGFGCESQLAGVAPRLRNEGTAEMTRDQVDAAFDRKHQQLEDRLVWGWISLADYRRGQVELYKWCAQKDREELAQ